MPELPEVQIIVDDLNQAGLIGRTIIRARVYWERSVAGFSPARFGRQIKHRRVTGIRRRGKFLVFELASGWHMLIHLRMSGRLLLTNGRSPRLKHEHVIFDFDDDRQLRFHDPRKFGRVYLTDRPESILAKLGPEPLAPEFTASRLAERLGRHRRLLKPLLLDQGFIAGLGNIYVDEALWESRLHPCRVSASLTGTEVGRLHAAIARVLKRGLKNLGTSLGTGETNFYSVARRRGRNRDELKVFRRTGSACPRCKSEIVRLIVGQRSTHICPKCQRLRPAKKKVFKNAETKRTGRADT
jgi:formamidopyrimidine-DNA glycosylase